MVQRLSLNPRGAVKHGCRGGLYARPLGRGKGDGPEACYKSGTEEILAR